MEISNGQIELKLKTDFAGLKNGLLDFISSYHEPGLESANLDGSWYHIDGRFLNSKGIPFEPDAGQNWIVRLVFRDTETKITQPITKDDLEVGSVEPTKIAVFTTDNAETAIYATHISANDGYNLLVAIPLSFQKAFPFILRFVERCKQLWEAIVITSPIEASKSKPAPMAGLISAAVETTQWVALNTTGKTISSKAQDILTSSEKTAEYIERMIRLEEGQNALRPLGLEQPSGRLDELQQIQQTFFGTIDECYDYLIQINLDNGDIHLEAGVPSDQDGGYDLVVVSRPMRPLTAADKAEMGLPEHVVGKRADSPIYLAQIKVRPVGDRALWESIIKHRNGERWTIEAVNRIKKLHLGSDAIITRYTQDGRIVTEIAEDIEKIQAKPNDSKAVGKGSKEQRKGGRPRNTDDDWAWEQANRLNRPRSDVYQEWLKRIGGRVKSLSDPRDTFNKALRLERGQGKIPEKTE